MDEKRKHTPFSGRSSEGENQVDDKFSSGLYRDNIMANQDFFHDTAADSAFYEDPLGVDKLLQITGHEDEVSFITEVVSGVTQSVRLIPGTHLSLESTLACTSGPERFVMQTFSGQ